jgi:hypothetical protein
MTTAQFDFSFKIVHVTMKPKLTQREINSMTSLKHILDSFYDLPMPIRLEIGNRMDKALGMCDRALREYRMDVSIEIQTAVTKSGVNQRFDVEKMNKVEPTCSICRIPFPCNCAKEEIAL